MVTQSGSILALDFGEARIGVALASLEARFASPLATLKNDRALLQHLRKVCEQEGVTRIIIGLPRGMNGQETSQTATTRAFGEKVTASLGLPISWQDEAVTSAQAQEELEMRGKPYVKEDIDALAATYILEDYLHGNV